MLRAEPSAGSWYSRIRPITTDHGGNRLLPSQNVHSILLLAITASLLWLVWMRPTSLHAGFAIAIMTGFALYKFKWFRRHIVSFACRVPPLPARHFASRIVVLNRLRRIFGNVPVAARATIGLLLLLNILITLALLDTAKFSSGLWATHTKIAFVVMFGVNLLVLKSTLPSAQRSSPVSWPDYFSNLEFIGKTSADRSRKNGSGSGYHLYSYENAERTGQASAEPEETLTFKTAEPEEETLTFKAPRFNQSPMSRFFGKFHRGSAVGAVVLAATWIGYSHPGLLVILAALVVGAAVLSTMKVNRDRAITMVLAVTLGVATIDYVGWRLAVTNWQGWWIAVPLLCAEVLGAVHILGFQFTVWPRPIPTIDSREDPTRYPIFILVPTLNEGAATLKPTLLGCIAARQKYLARHPDGQVTIVVCNDGRAAGFPLWRETEILAEDIGVRCVTRVNGGGAKAGNIENARKECRITGDALLTIFDADQVPHPDFLLKTVPPFSDTNVGWVQTGQYYANLDNPVSRWADDQQSMFYNLLCPGKAALDAAFICGTNVVIRAAALDEIGGLPQDSVTEDFAASIALHPRWRSIYLTDVLATGLGPLDIPSYLKQQGRWALGTLGVFRSHWRDILLPRKNGLRPGQRVQYFLACTHYLCGLRDLIYMLCPILFIITGIPAVRAATLTAYLLHFGPYAVLGLTGMWYTTRGMTGLRGIIIGFGSTPALIGSLAAVILGRKKSFAVTSKERQGRRSLRYLGVYVFFLLLCLTSLIWATQVKGRQTASLFISVLWVIYSLLLLASFLWLARADIRVHSVAERSEVNEVTAKQFYPSKLLAAREVGFKPVWNLGFAALIASPLLFGPTLASLPMFVRPASPFSISSSQIDEHYIGVSLPAQSVRNQQVTLERYLDTSFSIIGRTQDITDDFDAAWANKLAAHDARPWISLEFGVFGPDHKPPPAAGLSAIFNGVDDREITRWAAEIRDFGKPVYLTVLLQADKNWSVSSGVANGGIPEDVAKAWIHVQSIFRTAGADNVAWVWAPADPLRDQQFAPPPSAISAVLQDFINYPGTHWVDPRNVLPNLIRRYPGKPIIVEVSASGPASEKVAWLAKLHRALEDCPQLYALLYHQGGPGLNPTPAQAESWSLASDPNSLAAWRFIVTGLDTAGGSRGNLRRTADCCDT